MDKIDFTILELEHEYLKYAGGNDKRRKLIPIVNKDDIKVLIFNMFSDEKYRKKLSSEDFSAILEIFMDRIVHEYDENIEKEIKEAYELGLNHAKATTTK